ncbi:MAG: phage head morphogenesis protein [Lachnospiraceae bacterium]|nr:phage head morphogenesis protein [Butyrivibrio sp.]MCM1344016.1 phage head morphogenesis protein [Muribaculaceae bacterium]MCM1411517.1 phage head morphogenesis protein [Lachnospiraceae bacterium]
MDRRQREVQLELFDKEEMVRDRLKENYQAAIKEVRQRIRQMEQDPGFRPGDMRHPRYLRMLEAQLQTILHRLGDSNVKDMTAYLDSVYRDSYLGCLYGMHGNGVDLILRIDEDKVLRCINKETKEFRFDNRLYENVKQLKQTVKAEIARGFSSGKGYEWMARQISLKAGTSFSRAYTIARTEGHRVTSEAEMDCMYAAKSKGADVVKEWESTLDGVTRPTHVELDGQVRELEEEFVIPSSGAKAMYPGGFGLACEDVNCRCCMNQRAKWNLESEEYRYSRAAGEVVSIRSDVYREWKERYVQCVQTMGIPKSFPESVLGIKGIDSVVKEELDKALLKLQNEYVIKLNSISVEPAGKGDIFIVGYHDGVVDLVVNQDADFDRIRRLMAVRYEKGIFASKTFEDYIAHEMAHCMSYQDCLTDQEYYSRRSEIEQLRGSLLGMSWYGDRDTTGNDSIAEAFVRARRGERLPDDVCKILEEYIGRWKR